MVDSQDIQAKKRKMRRKNLWVLAVLVVMCWFALPSAEAQRVSFYVTIEGTRQGRFKGESLRARDKIEGLRFVSAVSSPRDTATGQASGKRQYSPIIFTKEWGVASPQILQALATNEDLKSVVFELVKSAPNGAEYVFQTIRLSNATFVSVKQYIAVPSEGAPPDPRALEDVAVAFQRIDVENHDGKTMASDSWTR